MENTFDRPLGGSLSVLGEKKILDLLLFTSCPDQRLYFSRISEMVSTSFLVVFEKRTMSSAYII